MSFNPSAWLPPLLLILVLECRCSISTRAEDSDIRRSAAPDAIIYNRPCSARWSMLSSQRNRPGEPGFQVLLSYTTGPKDISSAESVSPVGISVHLATSDTGNDAGGLTVHLTGSELLRSIEKSLTIMVPERGTITAWQLVAIIGGEGHQSRGYGFDNTAVTSGSLEPPSRIVACTARFRNRKVISEDTLVRIRHAATGQYLVMIPRRRWEAATLGYSKEYRFRLNGIGVAGSSVRIEAETHVYGGYKFLSSSFLGGVYFNRLKPNSESQLWTLSNPYPRDGDSVAIRSARWRSAALVHRSKASMVSVFCLNSASPDWWILEIA